MAELPKIKNAKKYAAYNDIEKRMFVAIRSAMFIMMPQIDENGDFKEGNYEDDGIVQVELFASTMVDLWPEELKTVQNYEFINGVLYKNGAAISQVGKVLTATPGNGLATTTTNK